MTITISGADLTPRLEAIMLEILQRIARDFAV